MDTKIAFGKALKSIRKARGLTQEDFSDISSRTFMSTLERGLKAPTLGKIEALSNRLDIHPLTLLLVMYKELETSSSKAICEKCECEIRQLNLE